MNIRFQQGVSSITAIFLITVLAGLGVSGLTMLLNSKNAETLDVQVRRANLAAQSGIEMGLWLIAKSSPAPVCTPVTNIADMPGSLAPYAVTVTCVKNTYSDNGVPFDRYRLTATACNRPAPCPGASGNGYVEAVATATWPL